MSIRHQSTPTDGMDLSWEIRILVAKHGHSSAHACSDSVTSISLHLGDLVRDCLEEHIILSIRGSGRNLRLHPNTNYK